MKELPGFPLRVQGHYWVKSVDDFHFQGFFLDPNEA